MERSVGFLLAFLKDYIEESANKKETFLEDFMQDIVPTQFDMKVNENEVDLTFKF